MAPVIAVAARTVLGAALLAGAALASTAPAATAACEPFPFGHYCPSDLPSPDDVRDAVRRIEGSIVCLPDLGLFCP